MSDKHTPGPWFIETFTRQNRGEVTQVSAFSEDGNRILCCVVESFKKIEDSRLIAAAPELLDALKYATDALSGGLWDYGPGQDEHEKCNEVLESCRAVIAKATGGST